MIGSFLGLIGGYYGGIIDSIIMRICDALFAFPGIILAIAIVAILGSGMTNVVIAVAVFNIRSLRVWCVATPWLPRTACLFRQQRISAPDDKRILFYHILPSAIPDIIVQYSMSIGSSILTASSLSFLGMGAQPPTPEWGLLLSNGRTYMMNSWHITLFRALRSS
ncbi:MAG: ABC transporter permease subunit [Clostridium sp.]